MLSEDEDDEPEEKKFKKNTCTPKSKENPVRSTSNEETPHTGKDGVARRGTRHSKRKTKRPESYFSNEEDVEVLEKTTIKEKVRF